MNITFNELVEQARTYFFENNKEYKDVNNEIYLNLVYLN